MCEGDCKVMNNSHNFMVLLMASVSCVLAVPIEVHLLNYVLDIDRNK